MMSSCQSSHMWLCVVVIVNHDVILTFIECGTCRSFFVVSVQLWCHPTIHPTWKLGLGNGKKPTCASLWWSIHVVLTFIPCVNSGSLWWSVSNHDVIQPWCHPAMMSSSHDVIQPCTSNFSLQLTFSFNFMFLWQLLNMWLCEQLTLCSVATDAMVHIKLWFGFIAVPLSRWKCAHSSGWHWG